MSPIVPEAFGLGFYANLGWTRQFFQPWLNSRNNRDSVYQSSFLGRIFGKKRRRRSLGNIIIDGSEMSDRKYF